jgi:phosphoribosyl-ATP pyrophosphohydrolase
VFSIDLAKWKQILKKLKEEKLETILAEGLEDVVIGCSYYSN